MALVGFEDIYPARLVDPPLTTVRQPMRMLGERACARLLDRIASPAQSPAVELLPTELVLRASLRVPTGLGHPPGGVAGVGCGTLADGLIDSRSWHRRAARVARVARR